MSWWYRVLFRLRCNVLKVVSLFQKLRYHFLLGPGAFDVLQVRHYECLRWATTSCCFFLPGCRPGDWQFGVPLPWAQPEKQDVILSSTDIHTQGPPHFRTLPLCGHCPAHFLRPKCRVNLTQSIRSLCVSSTACHVPKMVALAAASSSLSLTSGLSALRWGSRHFTGGISRKDYDCPCFRDCSPPCVIGQSIRADMQSVVAVVTSNFLGYFSNVFCTLWLHTLFSHFFGITTYSVVFLPISRAEPHARQKHALGAPPRC